MGNNFAVLKLYKTFLIAGIELDINNEKQGIIGYIPVFDTRENANKFDLKAEKIEIKVVKNEKS